MAPADSKVGNTTNTATINKAFSRSVGEGLFMLAARKSGADLSPSLQYWRNFARNYLSERCRLEEPIPEQPVPVEPLTATEITSFLTGAPPMQGGEYLSALTLQEIRSSLDSWMCKQIKASGGLDVLLAKKAPQWHQVGRVCFHLAENKGDPDFPFAFMATYASELSEQGRIRHQPLSRALQEYAGVKNRKALIHLLSPVQLATETSSMIKELVDSGDIYHPLAWSPAEAYEFLKEAPQYEQCGVVVRLPDWWKKRSRPRASVTIGEKKQQNFAADSLLDFRLQIALGDESLSKAELNELMAAGDGLAFIKGQWIEVDQEKLNEALAHWKKLEAQASSSGLSFAEGMRLLAGVPADLGESVVQESQMW
ncbi:MAG: SNF2 helicase-associated domain-containing protein, partial [Parahaliea sp.]